MFLIDGRRHWSQLAMTIVAMTLHNVAVVIVLVSNRIVLVAISKQNLDSRIFLCCMFNRYLFPIIIFRLYIQFFFKCRKIVLHNT